MAQVAINANDLTRFSRAMRIASRRTSVEIRRSLHAGGEIVAQDARERSREHSSRVAPTIRTRVYGGAVSISAGDANTPEAVLLELGNTGHERDMLRSARERAFRHPVFGNREVWVSQPTHPYLGPAALEHQAEALVEILAGVNRALQGVRLIME